MVGKNTKTIKSFAEIVGDFANAPYNEKGRGQEGVVGYSCLGLVYAYLKKIGKEVSDSFEGITLDTFHSFASRHKGVALKVLLRLAQSYGTDIPVHQKIAGDLVLVKAQDETYPAIYVGNGQIMSSYLGTGVKVVKCDKNNEIIVVRRF